MGLQVNGYETGVYEPGEIYIVTEPERMAAYDGLVYLTLRELRELVALAEASCDGDPLILQSGEPFDDQRGT